MTGFVGLFHLEGGPVAPAMLAPMRSASPHRAHGRAVTHSGTSFACAYLPHPLDRTYGAQAARGGLFAGEDVVVLIEGRIDNLRDLNSALGLPGDAVSARCLASAFERWGDRAANRLRGDFAAVIFDTARSRTHLLRDPVGNEPLHFARTGPLLVVASDAVQVRAAPGIGSEPDPVSLAGWVIGAPAADRSMFLGVERLGRGEIATVDTAAIRRSRYWAPDWNRPIHADSETAFAAGLCEVIDACVADRLGPAGTVHGAELSGGMDSTTVTASAVQLLGSPKDRLHTCTLAFDAVPDADETTLARDVATHLGLPWQAVDAASHGALDFPLGHRPALESPGVFHDPTIAATLDTLASQGATVVLTGNGGDEVLGASHYQFAHRLLRGDVRAIADIARYCLANGQPLMHELYTLLVEPLLGPQLDGTLRRAFGRAPSPAAQRPPWLPSSAAERWSLGRAYPPWQPTSRRHLVREDLLATYQSGGMLDVVQTYALTAEPKRVRVEHPLTDLRLLEFVLAIPPDLLARGDHDKWLMRRAASSRLPGSVVDRVEKTAFGAVYAAGFERQRDYIDRALGHSLLPDLGLVDPTVLKREFWRSYTRTKSLDTNALYCVLCVQHWLTTHFPDGRAPGRTA